MDTKTNRVHTVAAATALTLFALANQACHTPDKIGQLGAPVDVAEDTPNKEGMVLDIYAIDAGQPTNGNTVVCAHSCPIREWSGEESHIFDACGYNEPLSIAQNTKQAKDEPKAEAEARAKTLIASCNQNEVPPGEHAFDIRNLPPGFRLWYLITGQAPQTIRVEKGGATPGWHDMCIGRNAESCKGGATTATASASDTDNSGSISESESNGTTGETETATATATDTNGEASETDTDTGDMCQNDGDCGPNQICDGGICKDLIQAEHRPAGLSPVPEDDPNKVGNGTDWGGPNHFSWDWRYLTGELRNGKAMEHQDQVKPTIVTLLNQDEIGSWCLVDDGTPWLLECPHLDLLEDGEVLWGTIQVDSEWFMEQVTIEIYLSNVDVAITVLPNSDIAWLPENMPKPGMKPFALLGG